MRVTNLACGGIGMTLPDKPELDGYPECSPATTATTGTLKAAQPVPGRLGANNRRRTDRGNRQCEENVAKLVWDGSTKEPTIAAHPGCRAQAHSCWR
jgi:hypothetical protein